jgi:carbon storage regulator CsrA
MLVLTRKADEQILIGDDIKITLVKVRGGSVRIGIEAPKNVKILRGELEALAINTPKGMVANVDIAEEDYDDIAAVFAHPERNQNRTGLKSKSVIQSATKVTATRATVQKTTSVVKTLKGFVDQTISA